MVNVAGEYSEHQAGPRSRTRDCNSNALPVMNNMDEHASRSSQNPRNEQALRGGMAVYAVFADGCGACVVAGRATHPVRERVAAGAAAGIKLYGTWVLGAIAGTRA